MMAAPVIEESVKSHLSALLADVPIARGLGDRHFYLAALYRAVQYFPVFRDWPSPVAQWLDEAQRLARELGDADAESMVSVRRSVVLMRQGSLEEALEALDAVESAGEPGTRERVYAAAVRARIQTRRHDFEQARQALEHTHAQELASDDWVALQPPIARAELSLELNDVDAAHGQLLGLARRVPTELVEERVQVLQSLGFVYISRADLKKAVPCLDEARRLLRGAGVWNEVVQMDLVLGNFYVSLRKRGKAQRLFEEALELCQTQDLSEWEPVLQLGLARAKAARFDIGGGVEASLKAATLFARSGNALAYTSVISFIARLRREQGDYREAYRTLALGVSIAKRLKLAAAEAVFRTQIDQLKNEDLGSERFDAMVREMLNEPTVH